jgi:hypothetical protein
VILLLLARNRHTTNLAITPNDGGLDVAPFYQLPAFGGVQHHTTASYVRSRLVPCHKSDALIFNFPATGFEYLFKAARESKKKFEWQNL